MKLNETTRRVVSFPDKYAAFRHQVSLFSGLPGLTGLWTASHLDPTGDWYDWTKNDLTLTANGTPGLNIHNNLVPYVTFDGATDWFSRADEAAISITGSETHIDVAVRGLTLGCWFYSTDATAHQQLISKWSAGAGNYSYLLAYEGAGPDALRIQISDDGTNTDWVDSSDTVTTSKWQFAVGRFNDSDTGEELAVFLNGVKTTDITARAAIFDGNAALGVGARGDGGYGLLTGRESIVFLCAAALPDDMIGALFQQSRALYGV